jgi:predicted amidohydrolase YtcJ
VSDVPVADLVLRNAKVTTFSASQPRAESIAIKDGRVLAVGADDELAPLTAAARHTADLGGRVVLPGLNDSHIHAMRAGLDWERTLHWEDVRSLAEALARVREAADAAPRLGVMRQLGIPVGGGTDATRANRYSPWASIWWLVTGRSIDGATRRHERDRLSRHEAIASYTRDAAWFTGEDGWRGRLSPGYDADLCVPTADPFECAEDDLRDLRSDLTVVGGRVTHTGGDFEGLRSLAADIGYRAVA